MTDDADKMHLRLIPLSCLHPGEADNVRKTDRKADNKALAAMIEARGLLQPLLVRAAHTGNFVVVDGNRRLAAVRAINSARRKAKQSAFADDLPCLVLSGATEPDVEASLMTHLSRAPLHQIDEFEAFNALAEKGMDSPAIAAHFGVSERLVEQRRALGALAPEIRALWRKGKIDDTCARAFTLARTHERQIEVLKSLRSINDAHAIKTAITGGADASAELVFVGKDHYAAAGGTLTEDLFDSIAYVDNRELLHFLAREKLHGKTATMADEGYARVVVEEDDKTLSWDARVYGRHGLPLHRLIAALYIDHAGNVAHNLYDAESQPVSEQTQEDAGGGETAAGEPASDSYGVPAVAALPSPADAPQEDAAPADKALPLAVRQQVSVAMNMTLADCVGTDFELALTVAVASLAETDIEYAGSPARLMRRGAGYGDRGGALAILAGQDSTFASRMEALSRCKPAEIQRLFSLLVGKSLDTREKEAILMQLVGRESVNLVAECCDPVLFSAAIRSHFDAAAYFDAAPASAAREALAEMGGQDGSAARKKADLAAAATKRAVETGWLPVALRTSSYPASDGDAP